MLREFVEFHFNAADMAAIYDAHEATLGEIASQETNQFGAAVEELRQHAADREAAVGAL